MKSRIAIAALLLLGAFTSRATVTLPYYDGFDYTTGNNIAGQGSWVSASGSGSIKIGSGNLSYTGLTNSIGKDVTLIPGTGSGAERDDIQFTAQSSNTFFISFLLKVNARPGARAIISYASGSTSSDSSPSLGVFVESTGELSVGINTSSPQFTSSLQLTLGETYLVVLGYTFGSTDTAAVWLNPTSLGGTAPATTGTASGTDTATLQYFLWNTPSSGGGSYEVDELRIGATYAAVTPSGSGPPPPVVITTPHITQTQHTGTHVILHGTNGTAGDGYEIICTTNVLLPLNQWTVVGSNNFSATGLFDTTNPVTPGVTQAFYRLRVGGGGSVVSNPPAGTPPTITSQPQNQSAAVGQGALFSVGASGSAPLSYQWYFNTNTLIANATNASHTIGSVSSNDVGRYSVTVTNAAGSTNSLFATLSLTTAPTNGDWFVSTTGNDANSGTLASPFATLGKAASVAQPGQTIYMRGGTYLPNATIHITNSGTLGNRISLLAYPGEFPFLNFTNQPYGAANRGILFTTNGNHWNVKGLEIAYAGDNAIKVEGSYLRFEQCVLHNNGDTGLQIGFSHAAVNNINMAAFIEVINCDSYLNYDPDSNGGDADGFAAKLHCGQGIVFMGCRAWENSDDAWDLFETDSSVVISNCWAWKSAFTGQGNGNGFKLGGDGSGGNSMGTHYAYNCIAFGCKVNNFTQNSHRDGEVIVNCLAFLPGNSGYNFYMEGTLNSGKQNVFKNNASLPRTGTNGGGFIADNSPVEQNNSWNLGVTVNSADFMSIAETNAKAPRQPDGSLPVGFARLVAASDLINAGVSTGIPFNGAAPDLGAFEYTP